MRTKKLLSLLICSGLISYLFKPVMALTAMTVRQIQGQKPVLSPDGGQTILLTVDQLLGFTLPDGETKIDTSQATEETPILINSSDSFASYITPIIADGTNWPANAAYAHYYYDADGDIAAETALEGILTATWRNSSGVSITNLASTPNACDGPYTLEIAANNINLQSKYGYPSSHLYPNKKVVYNLKVNALGICYLKPANMYVYKNQTATDNKYPPDGYNQTLFDKDHGFIKSNLDAQQLTFPNVAFDQAKFQLIMSDEQSAYNYYSNDPMVTIDNEGYVTFGPEKPADQVTLTAELKTDPSKTATHQFRIVNWARPLPNRLGFANVNDVLVANNFPAAAACKGDEVKTYAEAKRYFFSRSELTNAPQSLLPEFDGTSGGGASGGNFARDADSTFYGEWGRLNESYANSNWIAQNAWTSERSSRSAQYAIRNINGGLIGISPVGGYAVVCRDTPTPIPTP